MKNIFTILLLLLLSTYCYTQNIQVETIAQLNASGGVTYGPDGNVYVSDFGPSLGQASVNTKVYKLEYGTWTISEFASGFSGASGATFDDEGNFYQSNPSGARISKRFADGTLNLNWATAGFSVPIGIIRDTSGNFFVCNCGNNIIRKVLPSGASSIFATSTDFNCPNGLTIDPDQNLYACNFSDGKILKITPAGQVSVFVTLPGFAGTGNGHLTYKNGFIFVATIGSGEIYKLDLNGNEEKIAGVFAGQSNNDGPGLQATFSKPNGVAASYTGDTLWVNTSVPTWSTNPQQLHPGMVRMITGICSLPDVDCPLLTNTEEVINKKTGFTLFSPAPNPADNQSLIRYEINEPIEYLHLKIVDVNQREVLSIFKNNHLVGSHTHQLNTKDLTPGIYFVVLENGINKQVQKLVVGK